MSQDFSILGPSQTKFLATPVLTIIKLSKVRQQVFQDVLCQVSLKKREISYKNY